MFIKFIKKRLKLKHYQTHITELDSWWVRGCNLNLFKTNISTVLIPQGCRNCYHKWVALDQRNLFPPRSGG